MLRIHHIHPPARRLTGLLTVLGVLTAASVAGQAGSDLCYVVADNGGGNGNNDRLMQVVRSTGATAAVGNGMGTSNIEATAFAPGTGILYAADAGQLGIVDLAVGLFIPLPAPFGTGDGSEGSQSFDDVDGLAYDPHTGFLYGAVRRTGADDLLIAIDPTTGAHIPDAFGPGVDYLVIGASAAVGRSDIEDLAIDPADGTLYALAHNDGAPDYLVTVDRATGAVSAVGEMKLSGMEGLSVDGFGQLYGTTGNESSGNTKNSLYTINKATGTAARVDRLQGGSGFAGLACLTDGVNTLAGTVFQDDDTDGALGGAEIGIPALPVALYRDANGNGLVDAGDILLVTTTTDAAGHYAFTTASNGAFLVLMDPAALPAGVTPTTGSTAAVTFTDFGNAASGLDFGYAAGIDLELSQVVDDDVAETGTDVTFTITLTNRGPGYATGVSASGLLPAGLALVSASASQGAYAAGLWDVGILPGGATATLTVVATVGTEDALIHLFQVMTANQADADSTPGNGVEDEDDQASVTVTPGGSSGGDDGGIESEGSMALKLARVLYDRRRAGPAAEPAAFHRTNLAARKTGGASSLNDLLELIPEVGPQQSRAVEVSPTDLLPVTNAVDIFAVNYVREDRRNLGALFATATLGSIYEHTKVICDRLRGAVLEQLDLTDIAGHPFIVAQLRHADGTYDHAVSFVVQRRGDGLLVDSRFRLDEYAPVLPGEEVFNIQVWSVSRGYTIALAAQILDGLAALGPVAFRNTADDPPVLPLTYIRSGSYRHGALMLELYNAGGARALNLTGGTLARTESGGRTFFERQVPVPEPDAGAAPVVEVTVDVGPIFDAAFFVEPDAGGGMDQLYLADGAWSYAYDAGGAAVDYFGVRPATAVPALEAGKWNVERDAGLRGEVRTWATLFRYLQPNAQPLDLSDYRYLEFTARGRGQVRLLVEKAGITTSDHYGAIFKLDDIPRRHRIRFEALRRGDGSGGFTAEDLVGLSFFVIGEQGRTRPFELEVEALRFGGGPGDPLAEVPDAFELGNYPNPFNPTTTFTFGLPEAGPVRLSVFDLLGREVAVVTEGAYDAGRHAVPFDASTLASGVYLYRLETAGPTITRTMVLMR